MCVSLSQHNSTCLTFGTQVLDSVSHNGTALSCLWVTLVLSTRQDSAVSLLGQRCLRLETHLSHFQDNSVSSLRQLPSKLVSKAFYFAHNSASSYCETQRCLKAVSLTPTQSLLVPLSKLPLVNIRQHNFTLNHALLNLVPIGCPTLRHCLTRFLKHKLVLLKLNPHKQLTHNLPNCWTQASLNIS